MTLARDVMETQVVRVGSEESLLTVFRLFYEEEINGAPVVDDKDQIVGVVSVSDLLRATRDEHDALVGGPDYYRDTALDSAPSYSPEWLESVAEYEDRFEKRPVSDVMTSEVVSVSSTTPIPEVVKKILDYRIHRVLVIDDGDLVGIISLFDLVALLE